MKEAQSENSILQNSQGLGLEMAYSDNMQQNAIDGQPNDFKDIKENVNTIRLNFDLSQITSKFDTGTLEEKIKHVGTLDCYYTIGNGNDLRLTLKSGDRNITLIEEFPELNNGSEISSSEWHPNIIIFKSPTNNPEDIVFKLVKKEANK